MPKRAIKEIPVSEEVKEQLPVTLGMDETEFQREAEENKLFERDETIVPFLRVLQPLSPVVQEDHPNYIPGAKAGMFYNLATETLYNGKDGVILIPITHQKNYTEWTPISKGGGFVKDWGESLDWQRNCQKDQINAYRPVTRDGTEIVYSIFIYTFVVNPEDGSFDPVVFPFTGTQIKRARRWASMMMNAKVPLSNGRALTAPYHYFPYLVQTQGERNEKGSWHGIKISPLMPDGMTRARTFDLPNGKFLYDAAKAFKQSLTEGVIKAATQDEPHYAEGNGENEEEIPF